MAETVSTRLPSDLVRLLDELARASGRSRSEVLRDVVRLGVDAERLAGALARYRSREVSLGRAAELSGLPITAFLDEARHAGILIPYDRTELSRDLDWAAEA